MTADAVVVLGAALSAAGTPGPALKRRIEHGVRVLNARGLPYLVVSGGVTRHPPAEADVMRSIAVERGVPAARILVEDRARNTFENAVYTGRIVRDRGWRAVVLVTDWFHMPRALYVFRRLGLRATGDPVRELTGWSRRKGCEACLIELWSLANSAYLFGIGRHKAVVDAVWHR
ncbi:MAG: YdcF family protein [Rhodospirillales bacterium]